jgi:hypothetical protein
MDSWLSDESVVSEARVRATDFIGNPGSQESMKPNTTVGCAPALPDSWNSWTPHGSVAVVLLRDLRGLREKRIFSHRDTESRREINDHGCRGKFGATEGQKRLLFLAS